MMLLICLGQRARLDIRFSGGFTDWLNPSLLDRERWERLLPGVPSPTLNGVRRLILRSSCTRRKIMVLRNNMQLDWRRRIGEQDVCNAVAPTEVVVQRFHETAVLVDQSNQGVSSFSVQ